MYDISNINIGKLLRKYRKLKHLSLQYVGEMIYKNKGTISKYENGEIIPDFTTVLELCNILEIDLSHLVPSVSPICTSALPFSTDTLYLYYLTSKKLITSTIKIENGIDGKFIAYFYNGIKKDVKTYAYYYEGDIECSENIVYMNFKNRSSHKLEIERVQIIISLPLSNTVNCYNCFITGLTPNFLPIIKRGILTDASLDKSKIDFNKLKISREELQKLSNDNTWILDTKLYDEFFYDNA